MSAWKRPHCWTRLWLRLNKNSDTDWRIKPVASIYRAFSWIMFRLKLFICFDQTPVYWYSDEVQWISTSARDLKFQSSTKSCHCLGNLVLLHNLAVSFFFKVGSCVTRPQLKAKEVTRLLYSYCSWAGFKSGWFVCLIWFFTSHQQSFSWTGTSLPELNQY